MTRSAQMQLELPILPYIHHDRVHSVVKGRRGARLAAITNGGAIPDNADYDVVSDPEGTYLGSVTEDFAVESVAGAELLSF